jgi:hypothetical protein
MWEKRKNEGKKKRPQPVQTMSTAGSGMANRL